MFLNKIIVLGLFLSVGTVYAQDTTLRVQQIREAISPVVQYRDAFYISPALRQFYRENNYSLLSADYHSNKQDLYIKQQGNGNVGFSVNSESFLKNNKGMSLWGKAYYTNEKIKKVNFNESIDYDIIYPYVMADSVGGDLNSESYYFSGGLSKNVGNYTFGLNASFKGVQAYRDVDPRPKNISSDIRLAISASRKILNNYALSIDFNGQKYNQNNSLEFVNELGFPLVFHLNGLGMYNGLLAGDKTTAYYKGYNVGAQLNLASINRNGFAVQLGYNHFALSKDLSGVLDPISEVSHTALNGLVGYFITNDKNSFLIRLKGSYINREGTEARFGNTDAASSLVKITEDIRYGNIKTTAGMDVVYGQKNNFLEWFVGAEGAFESNSENYVAPNRFVDYQNITFGGFVAASKTIKKTIVNAQFKATQLQVLNSDYSFVGVNNIGIYSMLNANYAYVSSNALTLSAKLRIDHPVSEKLNLYLQGAGFYTSYGQSQKATALTISLGVLF